MRKVTAISVKCALQLPKKYYRFVIYLRDTCVILYLPSLYSLLLFKTYNYN